jgi:hypothetical protein
MDQRWCRLDSSGSRWSAEHDTEPETSVTAGVRLPGGARDFSLLLSVQTASGAHPASYPMGTGGSIPGVKWPGPEPDHYLRPVPRLRVHETIPPPSHTSSWLVS